MPALICGTFARVRAWSNVRRWLSSGRVWLGFMGEPEQHIHFAREHTVLSTMGYLDGAVSSGERAARQVLASL